MSAKDRAIKAQKREDERFALAVENGLRQALSTEEGRAMLWWLYANECKTEDLGEHERRAVGMALAYRAKRASWAGWTQMRDEHDRPGMRAEAEEPEDEEMEE